jgi:hypothetical protein
MRAATCLLLLWAAALLLPVPGWAGWYCTGQTLWTTSSDSGMVKDYNDDLLPKWIGYHRVSTSGATATVGVWRIGTLDVSHPLTSPVEGDIRATAHQNLLCEVTLKYAPPPARPGPKPTQWSQTTWNRGARWLHRAEDREALPRFTAEWRSQSFAADRWKSGYGYSSLTEGTTTPWTNRTGTLNDLNGSPVALGVGQHCVAWVEAHIGIEAELYQVSMKA